MSEQREDRGACLRRATLQGEGLGQEAEAVAVGFGLGGEP